MWPYRRRHALLVQEDAYLGLFLHDVLERSGFSVAVVHSAEQACEVVQKSRIDQLALATRASIPSDAASALQIICARAPRPLPALVTTSFHVTPAEHAELERACTGAVACVAKPFSEEQLAKALTRSAHQQSGILQ